jgi:hypothetical protein
MQNNIHIALLFKPQMIKCIEKDSCTSSSTNKRIHYYSHVPKDIPTICVLVVSSLWRQERTASILLKSQPGEVRLPAWEVHREFLLLVLRRGCGAPWSLQICSAAAQRAAGNAAFISCWLS